MIGGQNAPCWSDEASWRTARHRYPHERALGGQAAHDGHCAVAPRIRTPPITQSLWRAIMSRRSHDLAVGAESPRERGKPPSSRMLWLFSAKQNFIKSRGFCAGLALQRRKSSHPVTNEVPPNAIPTQDGGTIKSTARLGSGCAYLRAEIYLLSAH